MGELGIGQFDCHGTVRPAEFPAAWAPAGIPQADDKQILADYRLFWE
jgi:hypothetical protein